MDPAVIAKFFHAICNGILNGLICPKDGEPGIFGDVSNYFGVVETNGHGMLHLHTLIWLRGNLDCLNLLNKLRFDRAFREQTID